jgi:hypothetical protein
MHGRKLAALWSADAGHKTLRATREASRCSGKQIEIHRRLATVRRKGGLDFFLPLAASNNDERLPSGRTLVARSC